MGCICPLISHPSGSRGSVNAEQECVISSRRVFLVQALAEKMAHDVSVRTQTNEKK